MEPDTPFGAFDLIAHPVFVLKINGGRVCACQLNTAASNALGVPDDHSDHTDLTTVFPDQAGQMMTEFAEKVAETGRAHTFENRIALADGPRLLRTDLRPDFQDGRVAHVIGSWSDVTDQRHLRDALVDGDEIDNHQDFVHLAAHDLRGPMQRITHAADMLRDGFQDLGDGKLELIDMLEQIGKNTLDLIGDVLAHAEAQAAGAPPLRFGFGQLAEAIFRLLDPDQTADLTCDDCTVISDKTIVQCVIRTLMANSLSHARADGRLRLELTVESVSDQYLRVVFEDNGSDFDPDLLFSPPRTLIRDSGFGMLGMRRIVFAQGGTIMSSQAANGTGARIVVTLPGRVVRTTRPNLAKPA